MFKTMKNSKGFSVKASDTTYTISFDPPSDNIHF